jgi:hypothetical protein
MLSCDKNKGRIGKSGEDELHRLIVVSEDNPFSVPEVDEILPLEVAVMGVWI